MNLCNKFDKHYPGRCASIVNLIFFLPSRDTFSIKKNFLHFSVLHYTNEIKPVTHMYIIIHRGCQSVDISNDFQFFTATSTNDSLD